MAIAHSSLIQVVYMSSNFVGSFERHLSNPITENFGVCGVPGGRIRRTIFPHARPTTPRITRSGWGCKALERIDIDLDFDVESEFHNDESTPVLLFGTVPSYGTGTYTREDFGREALRIKLECSQGSSDCMNHGHAKQPIGARTTNEAVALRTECNGIPITSVPYTYDITFATDHAREGEALGRRTGGRGQSMACAPLTIPGVRRHWDLISW
ncbi:hypothetical protein PLEOSDRAFT_171725 [Pleurotus ostreatus PC15]|uniref:Uncharacterized protein n=1 Tax=Pleurotus ostreatus (strain PC15) TaxID=1137138 RepID=A0A067N2V3_PLEO1|nr:hypothetical protein PLEOSDRAFT_171725 [Pleurotus ostreatus PC15]